MLKTTAAAVLAEHGLDTSALPATVTVERPRNPEHGDYATNLALPLGKKVGANPRELAGWLAAALAAAGAGYGNSPELDGTNINLEFDSANPTGPIHIGGTRWVAVGDALGRLLR